MTGQMKKIVEGYPMESDVQKRMQAIELLAKGDDAYYVMLKQAKILEDRCGRILQTLPDDQRDALCDFLYLCEEMSWRKLELACTYMRFPE